VTLYLEDLTRLVRTKTIECECGCWYWTGATTTKGYPKFELRGKTLLVYRYAYDRLIGEVPDDMTLDHMNCTSHRCIRPDHMQIVTRSENSERANATRWHDQKFDDAGNVVERAICEACKRRDNTPYEAPASLGSNPGWHESLAALDD
jgi:hypothetical protein